MRLLVKVLFTLLDRSRLCHLRHRGVPCVLASLTPRNAFVTTVSGYNMDGPLSSNFKGHLDRFNGVTVHSELESCDITEFDDKLNNSIKEWKSGGKRGIWFRVHLDQSDWVPILVKKGFRFHHAKDDFVMMYLWLPDTENCNIPPYAHTMVGVGAVVINDKSQILVVREKYYHIPHWKLPGGYVEPGENLVDAAIREVWEETGIKTEFSSLLTLRQGHYGMFDCSDIYIVISLVPLSQEIQQCEREIAECKWMDVDEYLDHPNVHELNRLFVQKYKEYKEKNIKIGWQHGIHQLLRKPYTVYHVMSEQIPKL